MFLGGIHHTKQVDHLRMTEMESVIEKMNNGRDRNAF
jgi:hypothetical protein